MESDLGLAAMLTDHEPGRAALLRRLAEQQLGPTEPRFMGSDLFLFELLSEHEPDSEG